MAIKSRANLKALFEDGDTLLEDSFVDLIDSSVNLADTTAQSFASNLTVPNLAANTVSADTGYITNIFADKVYHKNPFIEIFTDVTGAVAIDTSATTIDIATSAARLEQFTQLNGTITYTGVVTARCYAVAVGNLISTVNPQVGLVFYRGTSKITRSTVHIDMSANVKQQFTLNTVTELKPNDTLSVRIEKFAPVTSAAVVVSNFSIITFPVNLG